MNKNSYTSRLRAKGQITIPAPILTFLEVKPGDNLYFSIGSIGRIIVEKEQVIPPDLVSFWSERETK